MRRLLAPDKFTVPVDVTPVNPDATPAEEISQSFELMEISSPPSPIVADPVTDKVPDEVTVPLELNPVNPEPTPAEEISQSLELMETSSPPSPIAAFPSTCNVVPLDNDNVPEVKLSEVSLRRNCRESRVSNVSASAEPTAIQVPGVPVTVQM